MSILDSLLSLLGRTPAVAADPPLMLEAPSPKAAEERGQVAPFVDDIPYAEGDDYTEKVLKAIVNDLEGRSSDIATLLLGNLRTTAPPRKGTRELLAAYRYMPHLRSVVGRVAGSVASVPWRVYKIPRARSMDTSKSAFTGMANDIEGVHFRRKMISSAVDTGDLVEIPGHALARLLNKPNPEQTGLAARKLVQTHLETVGEGIFIREDNEAGIPVELWPIPPHWVKDIPRPGANYFDIQWNGPSVRVPPERVWYMRDLDAEQPYFRGAGIGRAVADELDVDEFAAKHMRAWFTNGAIPSMMVGVEGASPEETEVASQKWKERNQGPQRRHRVHFHNGKLTPVRLDDNFKDMAIVDVRKYEAAVIRETWNVPPETVGHVENSNLATIEEAISILGMLVVVPRLEFWFSEVNEVLARWFPDGDRIIAVYDNPIRPDFKRLMEAAKLAAAAPTVNEWRRWMALPDRDGGDDMHIVAGKFEKWDPVNGSPRQTTPPPSLVPAPAPKKTKAVAKAITSSDIEQILDAITTAPADSSKTVLEEVVFAFGTAALRDLNLGASFSMYSPLVVDFLAQYGGEKIVGINGTTRAAIQAELIQGVAAGEGIGPLSRRVREVFAEASRVRSVLIARTEVVGAANFAKWASWEQVGPDVVPEKAWLTTMDGRQRSTHAGLNGQQKKLSEPFVSSSGAKGMHPGAMGKASEDCNCRCTVIPVVDVEGDAAGEGKALTADQEQTIWVAFDRAVAIWEGKMAEAWRNAFARQQVDVLRSLERFAN